MDRITVDTRHPGTRINRNIYGHFSEHLGRCIYGGLFVGKDSPIPNVNGMRTDVVEALKELDIPVLRWPGGCFADEYHWEDGIGPQKDRKRMVNTNWGHVVEDNSFGTHEFLELCRQLGCEPYICGNVGSGTVREMAEWVEYLNSEGDSTNVLRRIANGQEKPWGVKYWGVGNESWGCGGMMRPEYYADEYRRYQTYCRDYGKNKLYRIACGPNEQNWHWMEVLMERNRDCMDAVSLHEYTSPGPSWNEKQSATDFTAEQYYETLTNANRMVTTLKGHEAIMDRYDPEKKIGLIVDEWGTWFLVEPGTNPGFLYQQNTMRDAMVAAWHLNLFNNHADRVVMANIAQTVNVLQSVILTEGDEMLLTPTYHVFHMYKPHMDAQLLNVHTDCADMENGMAQLTVSASLKDGKVTVTVANLHHESSTEVLLTGLKADKCIHAKLLTGDMHDMNTFENKTNVQPAALTAVRDTEEGCVVTLPACSVAALTFDAE